MADDYFLTPLDEGAIDHLVALLKLGYVFSTGDRGVRQLAYTPETGFAASLIDRTIDRVASQPMTEAALREHLAQEPRSLYDPFIVDGLVREAYLAFEREVLDEAHRGFSNTLALNTKVWAPHLGLCLVLGARGDLDRARHHLAQAFEDFSRPLFHFFRVALQRDPKRDPIGYAAFLTQVITIAPGCAPAYKQRADAHRWAGDEASARADLDAFGSL